MVTQSRNLRSGLTVWPRPRLTDGPPAPLRRDITCDVLVIGAGITGAMVADALADEGFGVVVVDRRGAARGSTAASTALVQYEIDQPLTKLARVIGMKDAARAWRRTRLAVDSLAGRLAATGFEGMRRSPSLYIAGDTLDPKELEAEGAARRAAGLEAHFMSRREILDQFGVVARAGLVSFDNIAFDPRRVCVHFLQQAMASGARLFAPVDVTDIAFHPRHVLATTSDGRTIRAAYLVYATGYEIPDTVPKAGHQIISTWAIATVPQRKRPAQDYMLWEAADPYVYVRYAGSRIICGGEDEEFSDEEARDKLTAKKSARLQKKLKKLLPDCDARISHAWAGSFGSSGTGLPTIGTLARNKRAFVALGYGGNGTTYSRIAAELIRSALLKKEDPDADLFRMRLRRTSK